MRSRALLLVIALGLAVKPAPAQAQGHVVDLTVQMLNRFFTAYDKEKADSTADIPKLDSLDAQIKKFHDCQKDFEAAGQASGSRLGGFAARMMMKHKCGASDDGKWQKERKNILQSYQEAAAKAGGFKLGDYLNLKDKLHAYVGGDQSGFSKSGLDVLASHQKELGSAFGMSVSVAQAGGSGPNIAAPAVWNTNYAWVWISQLFTIQYLSGATMFEKPYQPGDWTKWSITTSDSSQLQQTERAFLGKTSEGAEWWRLTTITTNSDNKAKADTVILEALFKPTPGDSDIQQLVRMRAKLPGSAQPQEMMVPQQWSTWNMNGAFQMKPTKESLEGATQGVEDVTTPAGTFKAKHVRFGEGGGTLDWWLDDSVVGGWVKFAAMDNQNKALYTMQLIGKGTGAKSELGITIK